MQTSIVSATIHLQGMAGTYVLSGLVTFVVGRGGRDGHGLHVEWIENG